MSLWYHKLFILDATSALPAPSPQDDDEEITVTWSANFFSVVVEEI